MSAITDLFAGVPVSDLDVALSLRVRELTRARDLDRPGRRLRKPQGVAERVAQPAVDAVEVLGRLLGELDALGDELLVGPAAVVDAEDDASAGALGDERPDLRRRLLVVTHLRRGEHELDVGPAGHAEGEPAHEAE